MKTTKRTGGGPGNMWDDMRPSRDQLILAAKRIAWAKGLPVDVMEGIAANMVRHAQLSVCRGYLGEPANDAT
ncbi:hypothetical protein [Novosphingobium decolorationis]|uniref:ANTAR domain-containing protein n=1 Tax=Novosphingobium decolorationis TaxID=2698673 RepID=A0ABX8E1L3_9SPHN|nr:hypothetical protein [Novosphingobium decolorationis]QVM82968.1 hypothetical protein HT578_03905 [Novosphingobium decolorationis]